MWMGKSIRNSLRRRQYLSRVVIGQVPDVSFEQIEFTWLSHVSPLSRYVPRHIDEYILNIPAGPYSESTRHNEHPLSPGESPRAARIPQPLDSQTPRRPTGPENTQKRWMTRPGASIEKESQRKRERGREGAGPEIEMDVSVVGPGIHTRGQTLHERVGVPMSRSALPCDTSALNQSVPGWDILHCSTYVLYSAIGRT